MKVAGGGLHGLRCLPGRLCPGLQAATEGAVEAWVLGQKPSACHYPDRKPLIYKDTQGIIYLSGWFSAWNCLRPSSSLLL